VTSITRTSLKEVLDTPETFEILEKVMLETETVGRAKGIDISTEIVKQTMDRFKEFSTVLKSSMQLDLEKGKPFELDALNGTVSRLGLEFGIPTPINSFIYACLKPANIAGRTR
jgi:2-dehydropantoate 2-reductase